MLFSGLQQDMTNNGCNLELFIKRVLLEQRPSCLTFVEDGGSTLQGRRASRRYFRFNTSFLPCLGYGNLSPSTVAGRIFCILFALFGIPLNLVLLNEIGQLMLLGVQRCAHHLEEMFHWQVSNVDGYASPSSSGKKRQKGRYLVFGILINKNSLPAYLAKKPIILRNN